MAEPADSSSGSLRELAVRILGRDASAARARALIDGLVSSGTLSREDADAILDELGDSTGAFTRLGERVGGALSALVEQLGLVREREAQELELRIAQLEHRVRLLEQTADRPAAEPHAPAS